jgi:hypothetical protein
MAARSAAALELAAMGSLSAVLTSPQAAQSLRAVLIPKCGAERVWTQPFVVAPGRLVSTRS